MIVSDNDALERLGSPLNLMNRLSATKRGDAMGLFGIGQARKDKPIESKPATSFNPFKASPAEPTTEALVPSNQTTETPEPKTPNLDDLVNNADSQVKLGLAHDQALDTLVDAVKVLRVKLDDIKPEKLPAVISATSKVVDQIQRQRIDANKDKGNKSVHFHFYTPTQRKVEEYEVVEVG